MEKDFDGWNARKKQIHQANAAKELFFREGEIWWCAVGVNVGFEHDGKGIDFIRPVFILKKYSKDVFIGVPLSTTKKQGRYYYKFIFLGEESTALVSQIRIFAAKRLVRKMGSLHKEALELIRAKVKDIL